MRRQRLVAVAVPLAVLLTFLLVQGAAHGEPACRPGDARPGIESSATAWVASAPGPLRAALRERGVAFPSRGLPASDFVALCRGVTPAVVVFDHAPDEVFALLIQTERHGEFLTDLGGTVAVSRAPDDHVDRHEVQILFTSIVYHMRHRWDATRRRIWWDLSPGHANDLRGMVGYWELHALDDGRTLGLYGSRVDVGPMIPDRVQASLTRRSVRAIVANIRSWVEREAATVAGEGR